MNCVDHESVEIEGSAGEKEYKARRVAAIAPPRREVRPSDRVASRVAEVLNLELARGSMPT
jgi:hypothetical protein